MTGFAKPLLAATIPAALGLALVAGASSEAASGNSASVRCDIEVTEHGGSVALKGVVHAKRQVSGEYRLRVSKSGGGGSADIRQDGDFSAGPEGATELGSVMLGANGGNYDAKLTITTGGVSSECTKRIGGML